MDEPLGRWTCGRRVITDNQTRRKEMLLRRITQHVKDQNWLAVGIDFAIVVFGVFIGLQVSNWNETRLERTIEKDTLIRLYADIQESIDGQARDLNFLQQNSNQVGAFVSRLQICHNPRKKTKRHREPLKDFRYSRIFISYS